MNYYIVDSTIRDGEYEYSQQSPIMAKTEQEAMKIVEKMNQEWINGDYREQEINRATKISKAEWTVIKKYIY